MLAFKENGAVSPDALEGETLLAADEMCASCDRARARILDMKCREQLGVAEGRRVLL